MNHTDSAPAQVDEVIVVRSPLPDVWNAVTAERTLRRWWGTADAGLATPGRQVTVWTGSSSFYRLWTDEVDPPYLLQVTASYLGVAPVTGLSLRLRSLPGGQLVEVSLQEWSADGTPACWELEADLWRQRLHRLRAVLEGDPRPSAQDEVSLAVWLPEPQCRPLHPGRVTSWLPVSGETTRVPCWFYVVDSLGARRFPIRRWHLHYDERLLLDIVVGSSALTRAVVEVSAVGPAADLRLSVRHSGWLRVARDAQDREAFCSRFAATWRAALQQAAGQVH